MGPIVGIREFVSMLRRRGPLIAIILVSGLLLTLSYAMSLPRSYEAVTLIQIEPRIGGGLGSDTGSDTASRLRLIEQRLMARSNVLDMIGRFDLYEDAPDLSENEQVAAFRQSVRIEFIPGVGGGPGAEREISAMVISVQAGHAAVAANLANDMARQIMTTDQETRNRRMNDLIETLQREDERVANQLREVQRQTEAFRSQNADSLPENSEHLTAELARLEAQRVEVTRALQALERELLAVEVASEPAGRGVSVVQRLRSLEVELAQARRTLPETHPEVQRLESEIEDVREGQVRDLSPGVARQVALIREQSQALVAERDGIDRRMPQIEAQLAAIPTVAARLEGFALRAASLDLARTTIAERLSRAELDQRLATGEHGERMVVLEKADRPEYPISSGRRRVAFLGLLASIGTALAAAFLLELRRPLLRTPAQLQKALGAAPIAVAAFRPTRRQQLGARGRDLASATILLLGILAMTVLIRAGTGT